MKKAELQVLNKELLAVNDDLRSRIDEMTEINGDLQNLINATQIGTILLDRDLRIERYTSPVEVLFDIAEDDLGRPLEVLARLGTQMADMHGLNVALVAPAPIRLPIELRSLVYQMVRELLFNVVKHAEIDRARVLVGREEDRLVLVVSDEGSGFDVGQEQAPSLNGGYGLPSVRHRLDILGGRLELDAAPGSGTKARLVVPLPAYAEGVTGAAPG